MKPVAMLFLLIFSWHAAVACAVHVQTQDEQNHPLPAVQVWVESSEAKFRSPARYTDPQGRFTIELVPDNVPFQVYGSFHGAIIQPVQGICAPEGVTIHLPVIEPVQVSLVSVIANPERYDGRYITVQGVFQLQFEGDALFLDDASLKNHVLKNAIWVDVSPDDRTAVRKLSNSYMYLTGRFNAQKLGHMNMFSGSLQDVRWR